MNRRWTAWSVAGGLSVAALYTLTPLTVCVVAAAVAILPLAWRGLAHTERHWLTTIVVVALAARAIAIGGLFLRNLPMHDDQFVGAVSGDEAYSMSRALRVRDTVLGSTSTKYDFVVAYDEYGRNSYVDALSAAQVIFGPTPYAVRVLNAVLFTAGALLLFRLCRGAFGSLPAFVGVVVVLFWPTLFAWSISLLKESMYFCLGSLVLTLVIGAMRRGPPARRALLVIVAVATGLLARDLRPSALLLMAGGLAV